jgi:hypothetical protein
VGVVVSAAYAAKARRREVKKADKECLSMTKDGPRCPVGQY